MPLEDLSKTEENTQPNRGGGIWRAIRLFALGTTVLLGVLSLAGATFQWLGARSDRQTYPPPGELVDVDGRSMHIDCRGEGESTLILDAGAGGWSIHWQSLHDDLASQTRTCAFDRAGLGWSEAVPGTADGAEIARQTRGLLRAAKIDEPVVYVGHSLGANIAQLYAHAFPDHVAGLVLVDPGRPVDMLEDFEGSAEDAASIQDCGWKCSAGSLITHLGAMRLIMGGYQSRHFNDQTTAHYRVGMTQPQSVATVLSYLSFMPRTAYQLQEIQSFGDIPLTILYSENTRRPEADETVEDVATWHAEVLDDMARLAALSSRGHGPVLVPDATHTSVVLQDEAVAIVKAEIIKLIETVRAGVETEDNLDTPQVDNTIG